MIKNHADVLIIGGGISGLTCARHLLDAGLDFILLEADQRLGGRIKSDQVNGFILDQGFQVLQTAYPEARRQLDFGRLQLQAFSPGVRVRINSAFFDIADPLRSPGDLWATLTAPIGTVSDRFRILKLFLENRIKGPQGIFKSPDLPTRSFLRSYGFSDQIIERFFRPFFAGACLDPEIRASSRVFRYLFNIFAAGDATLPSKGMGQIPAQLAEPIPKEKIRLGTQVASIGTGKVVLANGKQITGNTIVIAAQGPETRRLLGVREVPASIGERCLYFSARRPPIDRSFLILNGEPNGLVNNVAVPTLTAPSYSSSRNHLIAAVVLGNRPEGGLQLESAVREELAGWFGQPVQDWEHIKTYHIAHALPDQSPPISNPATGFTRPDHGIYTCGEYHGVPGIQWAMYSGRMTAEQIIKERK